LVDSPVAEVAERLKENPFRAHGSVSVRILLMVMNLHFLT
jgi:hypothetical protein